MFNCRIEGHNTFTTRYTKQGQSAYLREGRLRFEQYYKNYKLITFQDPNSKSSSENSQNENNSYVSGDAYSKGEEYNEKQLQPASKRKWKH